MIASVVLQFSAQQSGPAPATGFETCAALLAAVRGVDPALAERLHDLRSHKVFSVSPLWREAGLGRPVGRVGAGDDLWLRVTSIDAALSSLLSSDRFVGRNLWTVGQIPLEARAVFTRREDYPLATVTSFEAIYRRCFDPRRRPPRHFRLTFLTPTTFEVRRGAHKVSVPMPDPPRRVFATPARKWNRYAPVNLGDDVLERLDAILLPTRFRVTSAFWRFGKYSRKAFQGYCEYEIRPGTDEVWARVAHLLARFAFYAGIGAHVTHGMGQVIARAPESEAMAVDDRRSSSQRERGRS